MIALAQKIETDLEKYTLKPERFIDKVEIFVGPSLSFNYGNKFLKNYRDDLLENKRLPKVGFSFGAGVYHSVKKYFDINARLFFEKKGSKAELNVPFIPDGNRYIINSEYTYNYLTIQLIPRVLIGIKRKFSLKFGGYYSILKTIKGFESAFDTQGLVGAEGSFNGRYWRSFNSNGQISSFTFSPGLRSFERDDFGATLGFGYSIKVKEQHKIFIELIENLGFNNINKPILENPKERNHSVSLIVSYIFSRPGKETLE